MLVAQGQVAAAESQLSGQQQNLVIVKRKGVSDIAASRASLAQAKAGLDVADIHLPAVDALGQADGGSHDQAVLDVDDRTEPALVGLEGHRGRPVINADLDRS